MKTVYFALIATLIGCHLYGQDQYITKNGHISFYSDTPLEKIEADNGQVLSILDIKTKKVVVTVLMKSFDFEKAMMQEHFNENYVESDKFPKAQFKGIIESELGWKDAQEYDVKVKGQMTMHGKSNDVEIPVVVVKKGSSIKVTGKFTIALKDYDIKIPSVAVKNIAETIEVSLELIHNPYLP